MSQYSVAGKRARVSLGTKGALLDSLDDLTDGTWYIISAKGETSALPAEVGVGYPFIATGEITLAEDDAVYPLSWSMLCIAKDKTQSSSKGEIDATTDCDEVMDYISNELPEHSFTIAGNNAINPEIIKTIEGHFDVIATDDGEGTYTFSEIDNSSPWMKLDYSEGDRVAGDYIKAKVAPVLFTSLDMNAPLNGIQDFSLSGRFKSSDADGHKGLLYYGVSV